MLEEEEDDWEKDWETYNSDEIILPNISKLEEENNLKKIKEKQLVEESDHLLTQELFSNTNTNTKFVKKEEQQTFQKRKPKFIKTQNKEKEKQKEKLNKIKKKQKDEIFGEAESTDYLQDAYCDLEDKY